jgi:cell wall-associated NlpC family hydrolase
MLNLTNRDILWAYIQQSINQPYRWGGTNPIEGYDCSGHAQEVLAIFGYDPKGDQTAHNLFAYLSNSNETDFIISPDIDFGDLLFFGKNKSKMTHVSIALNSKIMVEAGGGSPKISSVFEAIKYNAFIRFRPIKNRSDLLAVIRIKGLFNA